MTSAKKPRTDFDSKTKELKKLIAIEPSQCSVPMRV